MNQSPPPEEPDYHKVLEVLSGQGEAKTDELPFKKIDKYTTFLGEFAIKYEDLVMHFFPSSEAHASPNGKKYWYQVFPSVLDAVARRVFELGPPRLEAQLIEGVIPSWEDATDPKVRAVDSWWLRARGYGERLAPEAFAEHFLRELDSALDATKAM